MVFGVLVINENRRAGFDTLRLASVRSQFAELVHACFGQEVILYQSGSNRYPVGYFAVATLIDADVAVHRRGYLSLVFSEPTYFEQVVPIQANGQPIESYVRNSNGMGLNGRRAAEDFRLIRAAEFSAIVAADVIPAQVPELDPAGFADAETRIRERVASESWLRSTKVRALILPPYNFRCAFTQQQLLSLDGVRSGLVVCHAKGVAFAGPDDPSNMFPAMPDFHARYDGGTIDVLDDYTWQAIGDHHDPIILNWRGPRKLFVPDQAEFRLDPKFLAAHRQEIFERYGIDCRSQARG